MAVDGSDSSKRALREALGVARAHGARVRILHVVDLDAARLDMLWFDAVRTELRASGQKVLDEAAASARQAGVHVEVALTDDAGRRVSRVIVEEAERWGAELLVLGTHGRHGLQHLWLGSVAEGVARSSPIPLLLVRGR